MTGPWEGVDLLKPVSEEAPCGENLEDTPLLTAFDTFRVFGQPTPLDKRLDDRDKLIPPPDWVDIRQRAIEALARSKDLRLLAYLGTALLWTEGLAAFASTLDVAAEWLEQYGSQVFPLVDEDALVRRNALNCFADPMAVNDWLRRTPLVRSRRHGSFALRDIEIAAGQLPPGDGEAPPDGKQIAAAFGETSIEDLQALQERVTTALTAITRINAVMAAAGSEMVPALDVLTVQFGKTDRFLRAQLALRVPADAADAAADAAGPATGPATGTGQGVAVGAIRSRQDAIRALDAVAAFFRNNEPSSPVPLFVERAKRLVAKDFLEVLADVAPDGLSQAKSAGGVAQE
jgi:type VI secretion system protein ImpA